jgi:hypothetical protein
LKRYMNIGSEKETGVQTRFRAHKPPHSDAFTSHHSQNKDEIAKANPQWVSFNCRMLLASI